MEVGYAGRLRRRLFAGADGAEQNREGVGEVSHGAMLAWAKAVSTWTRRLSLEPRCLPQHRRLFLFSRCSPWRRPVERVGVCERTRTHPQLSACRLRQHTRQTPAILPAPDRRSADAGGARFIAARARAASHRLARPQHYRLSPRCRRRMFLPMAGDSGDSRCAGRHHRAIARRAIRNQNKDGDGG